MAQQTPKSHSLKIPDNYLGQQGAYISSNGAFICHHTPNQPMRRGSVVCLAPCPSPPHLSSAYFVYAPADGLCRLASAGLHKRASGAFLAGPCPSNQPQRQSP
ncbi:unnamed protein product [Protopolystoma xenopodis]|uniref:Uncharacterized protein n=1 Tax=Protopolystoma xenopodis TaxID=117903 RepID=A0A3S5BN17_9PLAT|nr:unnamed protein product [Protopolystoma xenopodis]